MKEMIAPCCLQSYCIQATSSYYLLASTVALLAADPPLLKTFEPGPRNRMPVRESNKSSPNVETIAGKCHRGQEIQRSNGNTQSMV